MALLHGTDARSKPVVAPFGHAMRASSFPCFDKDYIPLNHGSFGAFPTIIREKQRELQDQTETRVDYVLRYTFPSLLDEARVAIAPLLGVAADEVVFVPNVTTAVNTVLRSLVYEKGDVILRFSAGYDTCEKTIDFMCESTPAESVCVEIQYPIEDEEVVRRFSVMVGKVSGDGSGRKVKIALFDTVVAFPGVRMPWEALVKACRDLGVLSLIDGAHGIGHIDLTNLGQVGPDFFTSNCYKWLFVPRGCAVLHVPFRNQNLIRTSLPTSWGFQSLSVPQPNPALGAGGTKNLFVGLFAFVATVDTTPYLCVPAALQFRAEICGGEEHIRWYSQDIARSGAQHIAEILCTEIMDNKTRTLTQCCFVNVRLPLAFFNPRDGLSGLHLSQKSDEVGKISADEAPKIVKWIIERALIDFHIPLMTKFHAGAIWVRFSGQIYLELQDFERAGEVLKALCERVRRGEWR